jgi:glycosyltransferase involved in cell wall biosynthesis
VTRRRPRVVFVHPAIRPYRAHIYRALQSRFDTTFYALGAPEVNYRWADHYGVRGLTVLPQGSFLAYRTNVSWRIAARAWSDDYDVWIGSLIYAFATHVAVPIVRARRRLFALWTEDWYWGGDRMSALVQPYCRWILRHSDLTIAAGSPQAEFAREQGVAADRIAVAFNSYVPPGTESAPPARTSDRFRVLYLGRLLDYKGPQVLLRAYAALEQIAPGQTELVFYGQGPAEARCRALAASLGLASVRFEGRVDATAVGHAYRDADVFVHPCLWNPSARVKGEAWGFVVNEAMAAGLPVITTTAVGAAADLVEHGQSGFVVPSGDERSIRDRLIELFRNPALRHRMGARARAIVESRFRPEMQADAFCDAVQALYERRHRR